MIVKMWKAFDTEFVWGMYAAFAVTSLTQDSFGREGYAQWVLEHWVSGWCTVPLALFVLGCCIVRAALRRGVRHG